MIFTAALGTETNTFSPLPTGMLSFEEDLLIKTNASLSSAHWFVGPLRVWREMAEAEGWSVTEGPAAFAQPGGMTTDATWHALRDGLLEALRATGPVSAVLLNLHGAMAATGQHDCSGELLAEVRAIVGPDVIVAAELDLHCHLTPRMQEAADILVAYKEYPHTDVDIRAAELFRLVIRAMNGTATPVMAVADCRMLGIWRTDTSQVRAFVGQMQQLEQERGVLSVSFVHGFPWSDVPEVGAKVLVVTDGDKDLARTLADRLAKDIWDGRDSWASDLIEVGEAVELGLLPPGGLTVLADVADNAGAGAASDSTYLLDAFLKAGVTRALFGSIWDPVAVNMCFAAGSGSRITLRVGGKISVMSGHALDLNAKVIALKRDVIETFGQGKQAMGDCALIEVAGIHVMLNSLRTQLFHPDAFESMGCDLSLYDTVVVKSAQHFAAGFAPVATNIVYVSASGSASPRLERLTLRNVTRRLWPLFEDPMEFSSA